MPFTPRLYTVCAMLVVRPDELDRLMRSSLSPTQDALEYEVKRFHGGFQNDLSIYQQAPPPEVDKVWEDLYNGDSVHIIS
jgi:hypothetical protein